MSQEKRYSPQEDVADFMRACGQEVPSTPTLVDKKTLLLRCKLQFEETMEFIRGAGMDVVFNEDYGDLEVRDTGKPANLQEMYDAIVDMNYVSYGAACSMGLDVAKGHEEVHRSNMTKISPDGTVKKNEYGKIVKPDTFSPADLKTVLEEQGYNDKTGTR